MHAFSKACTKHTRGEREGQTAPFSPPPPKIERRESLREEREQERRKSRRGRRRGNREEGEKPRGREKRKEKEEAFTIFKPFPNYLLQLKYMIFSEFCNKKMEEVDYIPKLEFFFFRTERVLVSCCYCVILCYFISFILCLLNGRKMSSTCCLIFMKTESLKEVINEVEKLSKM
jgi:hypothetical protein